MPEQPGVSVVIPTYNRAELVCEALSSALRQDWEPLEVIVVDDASSDPTALRVGAIAAEDDRVRLVTQNRNLGASAARNRGVRESRYPFVAFLDSDNTFLPGKLSRQMPALLAAPAGSVAFTAYLMSERERDVVVSLSHWQSAPDAVIDQLLLACCVNTSTFVAARDVLLAEGQFRTDLACAEDHDLWLRLASARHRFVYESTPLTRYNLHDGSLSASEACVAKYSERVIGEFLARDDIPHRVAQQRRSHRSRWAFVGAERYLRAGMPGAALLALARAIWARPSSFRPGWAVLAFDALRACIRSRRPAVS